MADAPKLKFWWARAEGTSILTMAREEWDRVVGQFGQPLEIDVAETPMAHIARCSSVVASIAHRFSPATAEISIYRYDARDDPYVFNKDDYRVWTDLAQNPRLPEMIVAASTADNGNLRQHIRENVFIVKQAPGRDHWLRAIPSSVTAILKKYGPNS